MRPLLNTSPNQDAIDCSVHAVNRPPLSGFATKPCPLDGCPMFADFRVHGLNKMGVALPFYFPVSRCRPVVKALEKGLLQPMYAKREHGAPVQGARLVSKREIWRTTNV
jgi:hypothetical protein